MVTAHAFASLSHFAHDRVILGLGAGAGSSQRPYGISVLHLAQKLEEGIEVIRALYNASPHSPAEFSGKHFTLRRAGSPMKPASKIPIYLAAYGPKMLSLTSRLADGWVPESHTPQTYGETLAKIRRQMEKLGRAFDQFEPCVALIFYPGEPDEKSYLRILKAAKKYLAEYPDILWTAGSAKNHPGFRTHQLIHREEVWQKLADDVPDRLADATLLYGNPSDIVERLMKFVEAGCRHIILEPYWIEPDRIFPAIDAASEIRARLAK